MKSQRLLCAIVCLCLVFPLFTPVLRAVELGGGSAGQHVNWVLEKDGTLRISGTGPMANFAAENEYNSQPPWYNKGAYIKKVVVEEGVTYIGTYAFDTCNDIESVEIASSVTGIGNYAFYSSSNLTSVTLCEGLQTIGASAFASCGAITRLELPSSVTTIREKAFRYCRSLTALTLPSGITKIAPGTFERCFGLESVSIPYGVTEIGDKAFGECTSLKEIYYTGNENTWTAVKIGSYNQHLTNAQLVCPGLRMNIYSTSRSLDLIPGEELELACQLTEHGAPVSEWNSPGWTVNKPGIIDVKAAGRLSNGSYCLTVTALGPGSATLVITDTASGAHAALAITVTDSDAIPYVNLITEVPHFYPDIICERDTLTNFYNISGLYGTDFPYARDIVKKDGYYDLSFTVYNSKTIHGSVDVYDREGNWIASQRIEKDTSPYSITDTVKGTYFLVRDTLGGNMLSFTAASYSKETKISIRVPEGGYFVISNNFAESPGVLLYNVIDYFLFAMEASINCSIDKKEFQQIQDLTVEKILKDPRFYDQFLTEFGNIVDKLNQYVLYDSCGQIAEEVMGSSFDLIENLGIDFWSIVDSVCNISAEYGWNTLKAGLQELTDGAAVGKVIEKLFDFNKGADYFSQMLLIIFSHDNPYIQLYTPENSNTVRVHGVSVRPGENSALPDNARLQVVRMTNTRPLTGNTPEGSFTAEEYMLYNICYVADEDVVQPGGAVKVSIPLPPGYTAETLQVLHQQPDGTWASVSAGVRDGIVEFEVTHFSLFALVNSPGASREDSILRLAGKDRFETAFLVADQMKKHLGVSAFDTILIASGASFADALSGSYLANVRKAPILLAYKDKQNQATADYIRKNLAPGGNVYILGGTSAVSGQLETLLSGLSIIRLAGKDRFETNLKILEEAGVASDREILVCTATNFADSLSASATGAPIFLVYNEKGKLTAGQEAFLRNIPEARLKIIGGESAVSEKLRNILSQYGTVTRLEGDDRFHTSILVAQTRFNNPRGAVLAYAGNFPDGLCGGPLAYAWGVPLILTMDKYVATAADYTTGQNLRQGMILGGTGLISDNSVATLFPS